MGIMFGMMAGMVIGTWSGTIAALVVLSRRDKACLVSTVAIPFSRVDIS